MLTCHLQLKMKSKTECPFLMYRLFAKIKHLPLLSTINYLWWSSLKIKSKTECPFLMYRLFVTIKHLQILSTVNLPLVEFVHILTTFYHLPTSLVLFTNSLIDASEYARVGRNHKISYKMAYLKTLCLKRFMDNIRG